MTRKRARRFDTVSQMEAAEEFGVSKARVTQLRDIGRLNAIKLVENGLVFLMRDSLYWREKSRIKNRKQRIEAIRKRRRREEKAKYRAARRAARKAAKSNGRSVG